MPRRWFLPVFLLVALTIPTFSRADEWAPAGRVVPARYGVYDHFIDVTNIVRHYAFPGGKMDISNKTFGSDPFKVKRNNYTWFSIHRTAATNGITTKAIPSGSPGDRIRGRNR